MNDTMLSMNYVRTWSGGYLNDMLCQTDNDRERDERQLEV